MQQFSGPTGVEQGLTKVRDKTGKEECFQGRVSRVGSRVTEVLRRGKGTTTLVERRQ